MRNHGTDPKIRMRMLTERVQAMIEIWTKEVAEYYGQLSISTRCRLGPNRSRPRTADHGRRSRPDVEDRIRAFGDGWAPMIAGIEDDVFDRFARLKDRTDKPLQLTASSPAPDGRTLARLRNRGAHRALVWLPQDAGGAVSAGYTERFLDDLVANTAH
jgi:hypothetical protein